MNYYRRFPADYANDTRHLTFKEHGAYTLLLDWSYTIERPLPKSKERIYRRMCVKTKEDRNAVDLVLAEFFRLTRWGYEHKRVKAEIARSREISAIASVNGSKGIQIRLAKAKRNFSDGSASQTLDSRLQMPEPETPKTYSQQTTLAIPDRFEEFWNVYPKKVAKVAAKRAWLRVAGGNGHFAEIILGVEAWKNSGLWSEAQFIPHAATFLNQRRWEDEIPKSKQEESREAIERVAARYTH